jgi:rRNA processing protein Gar1
MYNFGTISGIIGTISGTFGTIRSTDRIKKSYYKCKLIKY